MEVVTKLLKIDPYQTLHGPTVLIAAEGNAFWAHGSDAADKIAKQTSKYD